MLVIITMYFALLIKLGQSWSTRVQERFDTSFYWLSGIKFASSTTVQARKL